MPRGDQFTRQWRLLQRLGAGTGLAVEAAARALGCAVRAVWRDLRVLHDVGFPIYGEREGRRGVFPSTQNRQARSAFERCAAGRRGARWLDRKASGGRSDAA